MAMILIVDDHAVSRAGYRDLLQRHDPAHDITETSSGELALDALSRRPFDLVLLDMQLPGRLGMDVLTEIRSGYPATRVIVMSGLPASQYARHVMRAGASSFISKGGDLNEILTAVKAALSGHLYIAGEVRQLLATDLQYDPTKAPHERLSKRELQVFQELVNGVRLTMIAHRLMISVKTVSTYRTRLLEKMTLHNNADLTAYAHRHHIGRRWLDEANQPDA